MFSEGKDTSTTPYEQTADSFFLLPLNFAISYDFRYVYFEGKDKLYFVHNPATIVRMLIPLKESFDQIVELTRSRNIFNDIKDRDLKLYSIFGFI
ncbi:MAG: hypothetical protein ACMUEM_03410 [Flavobacteriales bacterium AspAUS03]